MTCHEARELFSDRVDGQLAAADEASLAAHLAGCAECGLEWARFERTVTLARAVEPSRAPAGFLDRVLEAARPEPWPLRLLRHAFTPLRLKLPLEVAALLLVGGLAVMIFQRSPEMQRVARQEPQSREAAPAPAQPSESPAAPQTAAPLADRIESPSQPAVPSPPQPDAERPPVTAAPSAPAPASPPAVARSAPAPIAPPAAAPPVPAAPSRVVQEQRRDAADAARRESGAKSAAPRTAEPLAARARQSAPDVSVWLTVADRATALTALAEAVARLGGREQGRRAEGRADIVDVAIPRGAYDAFLGEVSRLGGFVAERKPAELPASVSISLRVTH